MEEDIFFISHIVPDELPAKGLRKLLFYTTTKKSYNRNIFYWGRSKREIPLEEILLLEKTKRVIRIPKLVKAKDGDGMWVNSEGQVFLANIKDPYDESHTTQKMIFAPEILSKAKQIYMKNIASKRMPSIYKFHVIQKK